MKKDKITSLCEFTPEKDLNKKYENLVMSRSRDKFVCLFMNEDFSQCSKSVVVNNKATLCSPLTMRAFKDGISVPLTRILNPNNGLSAYSQFFEAVHSVIMYNLPVDDVVSKVTKTLEEVHTQEEPSQSESHPPAKLKKLKFLTRQLQLFSDKTFNMSDYCFAIESYPHCNYNQLRDFLTLPSQRKLQSIVSSTNVDQVLEKTFKKAKNPLQKNCLLLVDEVKIRPTVAFFGGVLNGMARNNPESKASSMLCVLMKCLHGGPSLMVSAIPVHCLTASYQFTIVKKAAAAVEKSGGIVIGSITDNHKINQQYCKLFDQKADCVSEAIHPLDSQRVWFLLYDTVHLLKCIRNNWITEKCQTLSLDNSTVGSFSHVKKLYDAEKDNLLKSTPLTCSAVYPSRLQLQNVQHVLCVFNDRVVAALKRQGDMETAEFVQQVLTWWNIVNVSSKGQDKRLRDPDRCVQDATTSNLQPYLALFKGTGSGHGPKRVKCLTHDTKRALVETTEGLIALCRHLFSIGFQYVLPRDIQSDRIEGEFSVYRQSTGANAFMAAGDVLSAFKRRLTRFSAAFLESVETETAESPSHTCTIHFEDAKVMEICASAITLSATEENACAYVAGWLERKCQNDTFFPDNEPVLSNDVKAFIEEVSKGYLTVPHQCTYEFVRTGLCFMKKNTCNMCCRKKLIDVLFTINAYFDFGVFSKHLLRRLANVPFLGLQNLEKDHQRNAALYQTSIKKARLAN